MQKKPIKSYIKSSWKSFVHTCLPNRDTCASYFLISPIYMGFETIIKEIYILPASSSTALH